MGPPQFATPAQAGTAELLPFTNEDMGISGLAPAGWTETEIGIYSRDASGLDVTTLLAQAAPVSADELLVSLIDQLGLEDAPQSVGEREANDLSWTLYAATVQGLPADMALAESEGLGLVVLLISQPAERDALHKAVFLPVVDTLVPLGQPAVRVANAFMTALKEAEYASAYRLCSPELQAEAGGVGDFQAWIKDFGLQPLDWSFPARSVTDDMVQLAGTATFPGEQERLLEIVLVQVNGEWRVSGFHVW
jgi:hypothetical protein